MAQYISDAQAMNGELDTVIDTQLRWFKQEGEVTEMVMCYRPSHINGSSGWSVELRTTTGMNGEPKQPGQIILTLPLENFTQQLADVFLAEHTRRTSPSVVACRVHIPYY